jgi:hypothetical protein
MKKWARVHCLPDRCDRDKRTWRQTQRYWNDKPDVVERQVHVTERNIENYYKKTNYNKAVSLWWNTNNGKRIKRYWL